MPKGYFQLLHPRLFSVTQAEHICSGHYVSVTPRQSTLRNSFPCTKLAVRDNMVFSIIDSLVQNDEQVRDGKPLSGVPANNFKDRETVRRELSKLWHLKQKRPQLFQGLPYTIDARVSKDVAANSKLEAYKGPDAETVAYLKMRQDHWISDPRYFWFPPTVGSTLNTLRPEEQMVGLYLQAWQSDM